MGEKREKEGEKAREKRGREMTKERKRERERKRRSKRSQGWTAVLVINAVGPRVWEGVASSRDRMARSKAEMSKGGRGQGTKRLRERKRSDEGGGGWGVAGDGGSRAISAPPCNGWVLTFE